MNRFIVTISLMVVGLTVSDAAVGQQQVNAISPKRDTQAIEVLNKSIINAGGLAAIQSIQSIHASGTISYFWAGTKSDGTALLWANGADQFRLDTAMPSGTRSLAVNHMLAKFKDERGAVSDVPLRNTVARANPFLPFQSIVAALQDASTSVQYVGLQAEDGKKFHHIQLHPTVLGSDQSVDETSNKFLQLDYFLDENTLTISKMSRLIHQGNDTSVMLKEEYEFLEPNSVRGVMLPTRLILRIDNQKIWELKLNSLDPNAIVTDSNFLIGQ